MVYNSKVQVYILDTNVRCICAFLKGGFSNAENVSAEEAPQKKGAWLQKENVNIKRT